MICLAGPTASGKSDLALALAEKYDADIVNADALQIYREWRVLTARPSADEEARVPHRLYGFVSVREQYTVTKWCQAAADILSENIAKNKKTILVGGSGLYFRTLLNGVADIPDPDPDIREALRTAARTLPPLELYRILEKEDPIAANRLHPHDLQRITRALEVVRTTGQSVYTLQNETIKRFLPESVLSQFFTLSPPRDKLYALINQRFDKMIANGAVEEVRTVLETGVSPEAQGFKAVGAREIAAYLAGEKSLDEATITAKTATRRYAKRQTTWFRRQTPGVFLEPEAG